MSIISVGVVKDFSLPLGEVSRHDMRRGRRIGRIESGNVADVQHCVEVCTHVSLQSYP